MPQQPNLLLDFNPAPAGGQFQDVLTQPLKRQERQASGWSGPAGDTFMLASRFLQGMQQGKVEKFLQDEHNIAQEQQFLAAYVDNAARNMPESQKAKLQQKYAGVIAQMMQTESPTDKRQAGRKSKKDAGEKEGIMGKVGGFLGDLLSGMSGGDVKQHTGKVEPIAQFVKEVELMKFQTPGGSAMGDPREQTRSGLMQKNFQEATQAIQQIPEGERTLDKITAVTAAHGSKILAEAPEYYDEFLKLVKNSAGPENQFKRMLSDVGGLQGDDLTQAKKAYMGIHEPTRDQYGKTVHGNQLPPDTLDAFGRPVNPDYDYVPKTPAGGGRTVYEPTAESAATRMKPSDFMTYVHPKGAQFGQMTVMFKGGKYFDSTTFKEVTKPEGWMKRGQGELPLQTRPVDVESKLYQLNERYTTLGDRARKEKEDRLQKIEDKMARITFDPANGLTPEQGKHQKELAEARYKAASDFYAARYESSRSILEGMHGKPMDRNVTGAVAETHNNPMNLEDRATGQIREFESVEEGWQADMAQVRRKVNGIGVLQPKLETLRDFFNDWAPKGDGKNDPDHYAATVADWMGVKPDTKLSSLKGREEELGRFVARFEGYKNWQSLGAKATLPPKSAPPPASAGRTVSSRELFAQ